MPKNVASTSSRLPSRISVASLSCSETKAPLEALAAVAPASEAVPGEEVPPGAEAPELEATAPDVGPGPPEAAVPPAGRLTVKCLVVGG